MIHEILILSYPKYTCDLVANYISSHASKISQPVIHYFGNYITLSTKPNFKATFIIFPILSDNRLPNEVEEFINSLHYQPLLGNYFLVITGDFDSEAAHEAVVASETMRLLKLKGIDLAYTPLMIDTPCKELRLSYKIWIEKALEIAFDQDTFVYSNQQGCYSSLPRIIRSHKIFVTEEWKRVCNILPHPPLISYTTPIEKFTLKLSLLTLDPYPRSLLVGLSKNALAELFMLIDNIPNIASLSLAFATLDEWPYKTQNLFTNLKKLDIRGNKFKTYDFLKNFSQVQKLNIACNSLKVIPEEILDYKHLEILLAYKNTISVLSDKIGQIRSLQKLNLYRNNLVTIPEEIVKCYYLNDFNLGANPIRSLPKSLKKLKFLKKLSLRNCDLNKLPPIVSELNLEFFDTTKNPYLETT